MNKNLRDAVAKAEQKLNEANCAIQAIEPHLTFARFGSEKPKVTACSGDGIILEYRGREIPIKDAIKRMEEYGYILPDDFV